MKIEAHDLFFKIKHVRGAHGSDAHLSLRAWLIATPVVRPLPAGRNLMMVAGPISQPIGAEPDCLRRLQSAHSEVPACFSLFFHIGSQPTLRPPLYLLLQPDMHALRNQKLFMILILMNMQYTMSWVAQPADIINCAKEKYTNIRYITGDLIT